MKKKSTLVSLAYLALACGFCLLATAARGDIPAPFYLTNHPVIPPHPRYYQPPPFRPIQITNAGPWTNSRPAGISNAPVFIPHISPFHIPAPPFDFPAPSPIQLSPQSSGVNNGVIWAGIATISSCALALLTLYVIRKRSSRHASSPATLGKQVKWARILGDISFFLMIIGDLLVALGIILSPAPASITADIVTNIGILLFGFGLVTLSFLSCSGPDEQSCLSDPDKNTHLKNHEKG